MTLLHDARTPPGLRIYAIGDVHGCLSHLEGVHEWIQSDLAANPPADWRVVHVGDYVDRGPDSRGVIDYLIRLQARDRRHICLMGNHDQMFSTSIQGRGQRITTWLEQGGEATLQSYGMSRDSLEHAILDGQSLDDAIPRHHLDFLDGLGHYAHYGDYFFVHAGIDPEYPLDDQDPEDLLWIRARFLKDERDHGAVIVHGHTPVEKVEVRPNRVGIDTGAVFGRSLTCLVLEDREQFLLTPQGLVHLVD